MKFAQLHYFLSQNVGGGTKYIMSRSPHKLGPCYSSSCLSECAGCARVCKMGTPIFNLRV